MSPCAGKILHQAGHYRLVQLAQDPRQLHAVLHCSLQPHPGNCPRLSQRTMMKCHLEGSPSSLPPCAHTQVFSAAPSGVATSWTECSPKGESPGGKLATGSGTSVTWPASGSGRWIIPDRVPSGLKWPFLMSLNIASKTLSAPQRRPCSSGGVQAPTWCLGRPHTWPAWRAWLLCSRVV